MVTRRRAIGGTGLAGGIFEGIMASEDIKNRRSQEDRMLALTESRIESDIVDRKAKALDMEVKQDALNEAQKLRANKQKMADKAQELFFQQDMVQGVDSNGGIVNRNVMRMKDYDGESGAERFLQDQSQLINFAIANNLVDAKDLNKSFEYVQGLMKETGRKNFYEMIGNLTGDKAKNAIFLANGITDYSNPRFDASGGTFKIIYDTSTKNGVELDISAQALSLGVGVEMMKIMELQSEIEENKSKTQAYKSLDQDRTQKRDLNERKFAEDKSQFNIKAQQTGINNVVKEFNDKKRMVKNQINSGTANRAFRKSLGEEFYKEGTAYKQANNITKKVIEGNFKSFFPDYYQSLGNTVSGIMQQQFAFNSDVMQTMDMGAFGTSLEGYLTKGNTFLQKIKGQKVQSVTKPDGTQVRGMQIDGFFVPLPVIQRIVDNSLEKKLADTFGLDVQQILKAR
tara:strand:+ start:3835 stop:5199 length:1365 start_codon:yes stop_codon:yes gene_type:complete